MRAMILAAGRGERMGDLTRDTPKPLLQVKNHYLIEYTLHQLIRAGIYDVVINISYHAEQIKSALGDGSRYGIRITYSEEKERLETGGGILQALPLLGEEPFLVVSCDIITDYPLKNLLRPLRGLAHLVMVDNPSYHPTGDFGLQKGRLYLNEQPMLTFANMGIYHPGLFTGCVPGHFRLAEVLFPALTAGKLTGEHYQGLWFNIGTPEDLKTINHLPVLSA